MGYVIAPDKGLHFKSKDCNGDEVHAVVGFVDDALGSTEGFVGLREGGEQEFDSIELFMFPGSLADNVAASPGKNLGSYLVDVVIPAVNDILKRKLNIHPLFVPLGPNATPDSNTANIALAEYLGTKRSPDGNYDVVVFPKP